MVVVARDREGSNHDIIHAVLAMRVLVVGWLVCWCCEVDFGCIDSCATFTIGFCMLGMQVDVALECDRSSSSTSGHGGPFFSGVL